MLAFCRFCNIEELGATTFYQLLMSDVEELITIPHRPTKCDVFDVCMLSLAFRLSELDQDWEKYIPLRYQDNCSALLGMDARGREEMNAEESEVKWENKYVEHKSMESIKI